MQRRPCRVGSGHPVVDHRRRARTALEMDIVAFVTVRVALLLLPVRAKLRDAGEGNMARALDMCLADIPANVSRIVGRYEVRDRKER